MPILDTFIPSHGLAEGKNYKDTYGFLSLYVSDPNGNSENVFTKLPIYNENHI